MTPRQEIQHVMDHLASVPHIQRWEQFRSVMTRLLSSRATAKVLREEFPPEQVMPLLLDIDQPYHREPGRVSQRDDWTAQGLCWVCPFTTRDDRVGMPGINRWWMADALRTSGIGAWMMKQGWLSSTPLDEARQRWRDLVHRMAPVQSPDFLDEYLLPLLMDTRETDVTLWTELAIRSVVRSMEEGSWVTGFLTPIWGNTPHLARREVLSTHHDLLAWVVWRMQTDPVPQDHAQQIIEWKKLEVLLEEVTGRSDVRTGWDWIGLLSGPAGQTVATLGQAMGVTLSWKDWSTFMEKVRTGETGPLDDRSTEIPDMMMDGMNS